MASLFTAALLAGAAAAAIALAPTATADAPSKPCRGTACTSPDPVTKKPGTVNNPLDTSFSANLPKGWTNDAQWARPGPAGSNPFGAGPRPPVLALN